MAELSGKKLLILGGNALSCDIVLSAKNLGVYTIVTDWNDIKDSPAKVIADEYWNVSIADIGTIVDRIKRERIEGVITGFTDSYLLYYCQICEKAELPCYGSKDVFDITLDKAKFKSFCRSNDINTIPEYDLCEFDPCQISQNNKVIIKPVDNSGSRGVILCSSSSDFQRCLDYALSFSTKREVIVEKYMEMDSFAASYTIQDGHISLSTLNDRLEHKASGAAAITCAGIYPSKYLDLYLENLDVKMKKMYRSMGVKNGVLSVQGFVDGRDFYVMEMGYRLTGGQHYIFSKYENGVSALDSLIHFALTGTMADYPISEVDNPRFKDLCLNLCILGKSAKVHSLKGKDFIESIPELVNASFMKNVGDTIGKDGTTAQKIANLHFVLNKERSINELLADIQYYFHVYDEYGNDLVLPLMK